MPLAISLIVLLAYLVVTGSAASAIAAAKAHTGWLPGWVKQAFFFVVPVTQVFLSLGKWLTHHLGSYAVAIESKVQRWFGDLAHYQYVVGYWSLYWPIGLYHFGEHLLRHAIPKAITARTAPLERSIAHVGKATKVTIEKVTHVTEVVKAHDVTKVVNRIERVAMPHASEWEWIHHHWKELTATVATVATGGIALPLPHAPTFPLPWKGIKTEVGKLWKFRNYVLGATGAAAIVATAIGGISSNCVKRGGLGKFARALCGLPSHLLNDLLAALADLWVLENVCVLIPFLEKGAAEIGAPLVEALTVAGAGICRGSIGAPATLKVSRVYPPPLTANAPGL